MGVQTRIIVWAQNKFMAQSACEAAFNRIDDLEDVMSDYRPTSELMVLCSKFSISSAGMQKVKLSDDLFDILWKSQEFSRRSDGAFDVTIGPLVELWRSARRSGKFPSADSLTQARALTGWRKMRLDSKDKTAQLTISGMQLDLGGIAKGYACDAAIKELRKQGIKSALVEMGGDIAVSEPPPGEKGWRIDVENVPKGFNRMVMLTNAGISSSGDAEQYVEIGGKRYSHIVDPRTGVGLTTRIAVTIIAPDAATSDGLSTAVSVLGEKRGRTLAASYKGVKVYIRK